VVLYSKYTRVLNFPNFFWGGEQFARWSGVPIDRFTGYMQGDVDPRVTNQLRRYIKVLIDKETNYMYIYVCVCVCVCMYACIYLCIYVYMYMYVCICTYMLRPN
jgi:hypothetical protein